MTVASARSALAAGDARGCLVELLAAWRAVPSIDLAEAIDVVGRFAARGMHAPIGVDAADREEAWLAEARRGDPVMRQRLIETVSDTSPATAKVARATALAQAESDPRTAMRLVLLATERDMPLNSAFSTVWNPLFAMLARSLDPRVRAAIEQAPWSKIRGTPHQGREFAKRLVKYNAQLAAAFPDAPPRLPAEDVDDLYAIVALARASAENDASDRETEARLLAAIHTSPGDLGARAIYADWLQERGDPRGEFIALQLAHPAQMPPEIRARLAQLLAQHRATWLGDLAHHTYTTFRLGFVDEVSFSTGYGGMPVPHVLWSTVRVVRGAVPATDVLPMPLLCAAHQIDHRGMRALASLASPPPLVMLGWQGSDPAHDSEAVADFASLLPRIPTLRHFSIRGKGAEELAWPWRDSTIRHIEVEAPSQRLVHWLVSSESLDRVDVLHDGWHTTLQAGQFVAKQGYSGNLSFVLPCLAEALDRVTDRITSVEITVSAKHEWRLAQRREMAQLIERHPRWGASAKLYGYDRPSRG